jgi:DNA-binding response OmpR family regulator
MPSTQVLFIEDEPAISEPFSLALRREGFEPEVVRTMADARASLARRSPDLVLLDLTLPDGDGRDLCRELREQSDVPIIVLTARGTEEDRIVGFALGADDYVVKPFSGAEVIARMRAVMRRSGALPDTVTVGPLRVDLAGRRAWMGERELRLSRKEHDLLAELVANAGFVVTREELIDRVWDRNWFGSTKTLDVHIGWLRRKLGDDPAHPRFIHTVRGVGFRFTPPGEWRP